ncbi:uncharacterized protein LOC135113858 [Scylla paramamosain]|uniref:uncharacterized protein LOC135113858 n=1 Tax=Scylla paramamosain TaxID=85552 RepID=UPI003082FA1D
MEGRVWFGDTALPLEDHIRILGLDVDRELRFGLHLQTIAQQASLCVSALRRVASFLDSREILLLYKAQIRLYLEYTALSWMSSAPTHMRKLDKVERRVTRLVEGNHLQPPSQDLAPLDSLEHRQDIGVLVVLHKAQEQEVPHLTRLKLPLRVAGRDTRTVSTTDQLVDVQKSRSSQHLRTYTARTACLWNTFTAATPAVQQMSTA